MLMQVNGICKNYGETSVLTNISLQVQERERIGLVGVNGAGKSTLLKIIAGKMSYDSGAIMKPKEVTFGYLAQNSGLESDRSIWDEIMQVYADLLSMEKALRDLEQQMAAPEVIADEEAHEQAMNRYANLSDQFRIRGGYAMETKVRSILHGMGFGSVSPDTLVNTLSGGQKTRLALGKLLLQEPDLLMLDEPTNHLDIDTLTWLEGYLRSYAGAILVVSHDRYFLDALVGTIYEIERTEARRYTGNYSQYVARKAADYEIQMKHFIKQEKEISRMEDFVQRNIARATTTKRAQSRRKALERMERTEKPDGELKRASFSFDVDKYSGKDVLAVSDLAASFDGKNSLFQHMSFQIHRGEMTALIGPNGIGKSTLLKILTSHHTADQGTFQWGSNVTIGYYDQEQSHLNGNNTVLEEVWSAYRHMEETRIRTVLGNFLFSGDDVLKKIASLSGGEKARVSLAKLMLLNANVLLLDEPTNHLDLYSREVLEASLVDYEGTLIFISHDRYFLNKMSERILELSATGLQEFLGNYDDYIEKKKEFAEMAAEQLARSEQSGKHRQNTNQNQASQEEPTSYEAAKMAKREERQRQRRTEQLEKDIADLEKDIAQLQEEISHPDVYNNYVLVQAKQTEIEEKQATLEQYYEEWETYV